MTNNVCIICCLQKSKNSRIWLSGKICYTSAIEVPWPENLMAGAPNVSKIRTECNGCLGE